MANNRYSDELDQMRAQLAVEFSKRPVSNPTYKSVAARRELEKLIKAMTPQMQRAFTLLLQLIRGYHE